MPAIDRIRAKFPNAELIEVRDAGQFFNKSPDAAAKLAQRMRFPVPPKKVGNVWMVNVEALAAFIDSPGDGEPDDQPGLPAQPEPLKKAKGKPGRHHNKTEALPDMSEALLAIKRGIEQKQAELDFLAVVFDELEREENRSITGDPPSVPKETL